MSASTLIDLGNTAILYPSICPAAGVGATPASGVIVGGIADLRDSNNFTNLVVGFGPSTSGQFRVLVQTADDTLSGSFTDPTSGLQVMPTGFLSGGVFVINSGNSQLSGGFAAAGFLSPHRYARALVMSGDQFNAPVVAGFFKQAKRTGVGPGWTNSPASPSTVGGF